ncbi:MAG: PilZ domain-containing protein [Deltaproteobacteria bacterium]|nr:PilZ domain-containing protein [Deltaproteobacteria bacterium]
MESTTQPASGDRRRHPRFEILAQVRFRRMATTHVMDLGNVSVSGAFVRAADEKSLRRVHVAEILELELFTQEELQNVPVRARVVRIVGDGPPAEWGFGLEFIDLDETTRAAVVRLVEQAAARSGEPPPLPPRPASNPPFVVLPATGTASPDRGGPHGR